MNAEQAFEKKYGIHPSNIQMHTALGGVWVSWKAGWQACLDNQKCETCKFWEAEHKDGGCKHHKECE